MFLRWLWLFSIFVVCTSALTVLVFYSSTAAETLTIWRWHFRNIWTFWLGLVILATPVYLLINYLFLYAYWYGYQKLFSGQMWQVMETGWLANILVTFFITWLYLGELPTKNTILALLFLTGALLAILWK